jgi:TatD DNase family protein
MKFSKFSSEETLIDVHAHLDKVDQIDRAIQNAQAVGVEHIVAVGMDVDSNQKTLDLAGRYSNIIYPAIGYHPWEIRADEIDETLSFLEENVASCIAIGEIGLDYKTKVKKTIQRDVFSRILQFSVKKGKPVIIHSRFSHERCHRMVSSAGVAKAVFHWYTGPTDVLDRIIEDGYFVSATPALAYSPPHQAAMKKAPLDQTLVETDTPVAYQGKVSEPAHLLKTLSELSRIKNIPIAELACITTANAKRFFSM